MNIIKRKFMTVILLAALLASAVSGCAQEKDAAAAPFTIDSAHTLVVYTSHKAEVYSPIIREFEQRTGIYVEVHAGGTIEMLNEIKNGADADVMFGGGVETYQAYRDCIEPYRSAEQDHVDGKYASAEGLYTLFSDLPLVFVYNRKLVNEADAPRAWNDFMKSQWSGRIAFADPQNSGTSVTILLAMASILTGSEQEVISRFSTQVDGQSVSSSGKVLSAVDSGSCLVGITLEETARKWMLTHQDVGMIYPEDGTVSMPDGSFLVRGCAHPENARKFIDFTVSEDVQRLLVEQMFRRSVRTDITGIPDQKEISYADMDLDWAADQQKEVLKVWESVNP